MALALNILALIIVLGLCWAAMMWLSGRFHDHRRDDVIDRPAPGEWRPELGEAPCQMCEGVGASTRRGRLQPCPMCEGTGVLS